MSTGQIYLLHNSPWKKPPPNHHGWRLQRPHPLSWIQLPWKRSGRVMQFLKFNPQTDHWQPTYSSLQKISNCSRADLTILSADPLETTTVRVLDGIGSDHLPILTSIQKLPKTRDRGRKTFWNSKKASWNYFSSSTDVGTCSVDIENDHSTQCPLTNTRSSWMTQLIISLKVM